MEVVLSGGKEYAAVEAMRPHCSRQSRRSHCSRRRGGPTAPTARRSRLSHYSTEARGDPATASTSTGVGEQGPIWGQRAQIWTPIFFLKTDFGCRQGTTDTKNRSFFISYKWYRPEQPILKMGYRPTLKMYSVVLRVSSHCKHAAIQESHR
jgi:hypothetical protein